MDGLADIAAFGQEGYEVFAVAFGAVPVDAGFLGLDQDAEGEVAHRRHGQMVGRELVGQGDFVVLVLLRGGLEVHHAALAVHLGHEVDDADQGRIHVRDHEFKRFLAGLDVPDAR